MASFQPSQEVMGAGMWTFHDVKQIWVYIKLTGHPGGHGAMCSFKRMKGQARIQV